MSKLPAMQFYIGDWMKDPGLRRCSKRAKGVWIDALCVLFECQERGVFATDGQPWSLEEIAVAIGGDTAENLAGLHELMRLGIASRNDDGALINRRMVRDERVRTKSKGRQQNFRKKMQENSNRNGENNADVTQSEDVRNSEFSKEIEAHNAARNASVTQTVTPMSHGASSSSSSSSSSSGQEQRQILSSTSSSQSPSATPTSESQRDALEDDLEPADDGADVSERLSAPESTQRRSLPPSEAREQAPDDAKAAEKRRIAKLENDVVRSMFGFYCEKLHRDAARYTLTDARRKKALSRLHERIAATGSLAGAVRDFEAAITNLAASTYHVENGYIDWNEQIVRSAEEFEKRLNWHKPATTNGGANGQHAEHRERFESVSEHNKRVADEAIARLDERDRQAAATARGDAKDKSA